ncbi:MAG: metallophosphoesterase [Rhodospirillales bacterium]|nr:metallophosphoesterase [Alphaproteobacteria bacterium]MCB9977489.1 metallophosphoesterase [Rhodospirillales bacterium]
MEKVFLPALREPVSLFVSDTHLFHQHNSALQYQGQMIEQVNPDRLFLIGDIIDYEYIMHIIQKRMKAGGNGQEVTLPANFEDFLEELDVPAYEAHLRFMDVVMAQIDRGTEVYFIPGNHDNTLDIFNGQTLNGIHVRDHMLERFGGIITHLEHGDENDPACLANYEGLYSKGSRILDAGLHIDHRLKRAFESVSPGSIHYPFPITNSLKHIGKFFIASFRRNAALRALERGAAATITGHIHKADIRMITDISTGRPMEMPGTVGAQFVGSPPSRPKINVKYMNTGDGLTHGTALLHMGREVPNLRSMDGWVILTRHDIQKSRTFDPAAENPHAEYRDETIDFLQKGWEAFIASTEFDKAWDHTGKRIRWYTENIAANSQTEHGEEEPPRWEHAV